MKLETNVRAIASIGKCSEFGGPYDLGMSDTEGLAIYSPSDSDPYSLFMTGGGRLGHDLNPDALYCAMRWDYTAHPRLLLKHSVLAVSAHNHGSVIYVHPVDYGPAYKTGRIIDLSPGALRALGVGTDDTVYVTGLFDASQL